MIITYLLLFISMKPKVILLLLLQGQLLLPILCFHVATCLKHLLHTTGKWT